LSEVLQTAKQTAKNIFAIPRLSPRVEQERRASVFGMIESGKTTVLGELEIVCVEYANKANKPGSKSKFHFLVIERTSGIRQVGSELRKGMFPAKTPPDRIFEADFIMRFDGAFGKQQIRLPFCETAGETFNKILDKFQKGQYDINPDLEEASLIVDYILNTDAIVLIAPVTRGVGTEPDLGAQLQLPDVNLSRLLSAIYEYKLLDAQNNPNYRPIKGIAVFLTKYDALEKELVARQMNLTTKEGVHAFMSRYFPETYSVLGFYGLENVRFWPTGLDIETELIETQELDEFGKPKMKRVGKIHPLNPSRGWKIKVDYNRNMPMGKYEEPLLEFIEWLKTTVMA